MLVTACVTAMTRLVADSTNRMPRHKIGAKVTDEKHKNELGGYVSYIHIEKTKFLR